MEALTKSSGPYSPENLKINNLIFFLINPNIKPKPNPNLSFNPYPKHNLKKKIDFYTQKKDFYTKKKGFIYKI